ncbi:hypothetical protein Tsubulata_029520, partial [Turnera subulata]
MEATNCILALLIACSFFSLASGGNDQQNLRGEWKLAMKNAGVASMHMQLLPDGKVIFYDRTDAGSSNISLPGGKCISRPHGVRDCSAHSVEYNPETKTIRALTVWTETWCSSGALGRDGTLVQTGGDAGGELRTRFFKPWVNGDWAENKAGLLARRWYASNQMLPDGRSIVVGGRKQFNYEFVPKFSKSDHTLHELPFLRETFYANQVENNLYPFTHLAPDGNLFIFANKRAILLDYINNKVVRNYPEMPGGFARNYPSTGSSALLPIHLSNNSNAIPDATVFICGGTWPNAYARGKRGIFLPASKTCGRLSITAANPTWEMEEMPMNRVMGDMVMLPTGDVLIINGASNGSAGWELARGPVLNPVLYSPNKTNDRFEVLKPSTIPRMYHSTAVLLPDTSVLVAGSNPHQFYNFTTTTYPTDLSMENFYPPYFSTSSPVPEITWTYPVDINHNQKLEIGFVLKGGSGSVLGDVYVTMVAPSFNTHTFSMNQRLLVLAQSAAYKKDAANYVVEVTTPATGALAPAGFYLVFVVHEGVPSAGKWGKWKLLKRSIGVSAMHMQLLPNDRIIAFDRTNFGPSNISLPDGKCIGDASVSTNDCYSHSVEFDPFTRAIRPLTILTDTWCSSGALLPDGILVQSGGYRLGERVVRTFKPCPGCDWMENPNGLIKPRWYASNQLLPDGKVIVVGGRYEFNYEFIPKEASSGSDQTLYQLPFLEETRYSPLIPNNLYPFLHLSPDGNLFIFANDRAILLDYVNNKVVRTYPVMPGGISRNYPSTGSSALLPLVLSSNSTTSPDADILVCGGTSPDSNDKANNGNYLPASKSCGRLTITAANPSWEMEEMPLERVMGDMIMLPTGDVLIINGAAKGTAGWNAAREPALNPVIYRPNQTPSENSRFETMSPSPIPRLYHSTAHLLSDGRVLVGGSNPNRNYNFTALYPTELSLEAFYPPYLTSNKSRPSVNSVKPGFNFNYKQKFRVEFKMEVSQELGNVMVTMLSPSFTTHSFSMNQRLLVLAQDNAVQKADACNYVVDVNAPATAALAPPGYYQLFLSNGTL